MRLEDVYTAIVTFSLVSILAFTLTVVVWASWNDYVLYETVEAVELVGDNYSLMSDAMLNSTVEGAKEYYNLSSYFDGWWLASYVLFFISSLMLAYSLPKSGYFNLTIMLFYGFMILLFIGSIINQITDYWQEQVLYRLVPAIQTEMPIFAFYLAHVGIFSLIHFVLCLMLNVIDFDFKGHGIGEQRQPLDQQEEV